MTMGSRYAESVDRKISLGPVWAVNPCYVESIEAVITGDDDNWLNVNMMGKKQLSTELESKEFVEALVAELIAANPGIVVLPWPRDKRAA